jgi:hypothetical protein
MNDLLPQRTGENVGKAELGIVTKWILVAEVSEILSAYSTHSSVRTEAEFASDTVDHAHFLESSIAPSANAGYMNNDLRNNSANRSLFLFPTSRNLEMPILRGWPNHEMIFTEIERHKNDLLGFRIPLLVVHYTC